MRLQDIMTTKVYSAGPNDPVESAWTQMRLHNAHHLVVIENGRVVGIVSDRDLGSSRGELLREGQLVGDVMSTRPLTAEPTMTLRRAANLLRGHSVGCLPIIDRTRLVGIVTTADLLDALGHAHERPVEKGTRWVMRGRGQRRKRAPGLHR
jgi:acetoin utilization protein AcuB